MKRTSAAGIAAAIATAIASGFVWWQHRAPSAPKGCTEAALRARVVAAAEAELGKADLRKYFADAAPQFEGQSPEWCGIFDLWAIHQAGLGLDVQWKTGVGFLFKLKRTATPKPGDVAYYHEMSQHHALVRAVRGDVVDVINGNGNGGVVTASSPPLSKATDYYSIQPWIDAAIARGCK